MIHPARRCVMPAVVLRAAAGAAPTKNDNPHDSRLDRRSAVGAGPAPARARDPERTRAHAPRSIATDPAQIGWRVVASSTTPAHTPAAHEAAALQHLRT